MSMTDPVFQWLAYELAFIFAILFVWGLLRARRKHKRAQAAAAKTAKLIKNSHEQRFAALSSQLSERYGLSGAALDSMVEELMLREKEIFKSIVNLYSQQDEKTLNNFPEQITSLTDATLSIMQADLEEADSELIDSVDESTPSEASELETDLAEDNTDIEEDAQAEATADFDGVFDDENAEVVVAETEMLDDETVVNDQADEADIDFDIELADAETDEVDIDDIFNQTQIADEEVEPEAEAEQGLESEPEPELASEIVTETEKPALRMADFLKNDWNPAIPDIYGKTTSENLAPLTAVDETEEEKVGSLTELKSMKSYLNKAWTNQVPDIYGKSPEPEAAEKIGENETSFEHQELKFHAFESGDSNQSLMSPVEVSEIELDIEQPDELDSASDERISAAEIDDLMRVADVPADEDTDEPVNTKKQNVIEDDNGTTDSLADEITSPEQDDMLESDIADDPIESMEQVVETAEINSIDDLSPEADESSEQYTEQMEAVESAEFSETANDAAAEPLEQTQEIEHTAMESDQSVAQEQVDSAGSSESLTPQPNEQTTAVNSEVNLNTQLDESENTDWENDLLIDDNDSTLMDNQQEELTESSEFTEPEQPEPQETLAEEAEPAEQTPPLDMESSEVIEASGDVAAIPDAEETLTLDESTPEAAEFTELEQPVEPEPQENSAEEIDLDDQIPAEEVESKETEESPEDVAELPDAEDTLALDESSPEMTEIAEPEQPVEPQSQEASAEEAEPAEQTPPLDIDSSEASEAPEDVAELPDAEDTLALDESSSEMTEIAELEQPVEPEAQENSAEEIDLDDQIPAEEMESKETEESPENVAELPDAEDTLALDESSPEMTEIAEPEQLIEPEPQEASVEEAVPTEQIPPLDMESNEASEAPEDVAEIPDVEDTLTLDESAPEAAEFTDPEQFIESQSPEATVEQIEPAESVPPLDRESDEELEATQDLTELPDLEETLAIDESSPVTAEPTELEQPIEPEPQETSAEEMETKETEEAAEDVAEIPDIEETLALDESSAETTELTKPEQPVEPELQEAESAYQNEEERLAGIMSSQPIEELTPDETISEESSKTIEPVNEIEKLRAKLRERTQRLKAARKQRLSEEPSMAATPPIETAVDEGELSNEPFIEASNESNSNTTVEQAGFQPETLDNPSTVEESFADAGDISNDKTDSSDNTPATDHDQSNEPHPLLVADPVQNKSPEPSASGPESDVDTDFASTAKTTDKNAMSPQSDKQPYAFQGMPAFIEEEIELSTANGYRMNSTQELISDVKKAPLISMSSSDEYKNEPSKSQSNDENKQTNDDEWVSELLMDQTPQTMANKTQEATSSEKIESSPVQTADTSDMDSPENATVTTKSVDDVIQKPNLIQSDEDFAAALAAEQAQADLDRKQTQSEIAVFDIPEQPDLPEPERMESFLKDVEKLQATQFDKNTSLIPPTQEAPLPDPAHLDSLLGEVDKLTAVKKPVKSKKKQSELQAILSTIPSFSGSKKPKYK